MEFTQVVQRVGIKEYPEEMAKIYAQLPADNTPVCDLELIDKLQREYKVFGKYYDLVTDAAVQINADEAFSAWVRVLSVYCVENPSKPPVPEFDGDLKKDFVSLFALVPEIPSGIEKYKAYGFSEEEITENMHAFEKGIGAGKGRIGRPGVNQLYFGWLTHFSRAQIFKLHGLQFELRKMPISAAFLRNKHSGQLLPVMVSGEFDASGKQRIGSKGYEEPREGSFAPKFTEDEHNYYGHSAVNCVVSNRLQTFPKAQWECVARPGDKSLGMHFPKGADISQENFNKAIAAARKLLQERFPEYVGCPIECSSWLLDPGLEDILGPNSKIVQLGKRYARFPVKSAGKHVFGFVFPANVDNYEDLPENTTLERGLKQLYLNGGCNYAFRGMVVE